jgi:hypothetical protein
MDTSAECCVLRDLAEILRLGGRRPPGAKRFGESRFKRRFLFLGEYPNDLESVDVPGLDIGLGSLMKPYRSTLEPSTSSQSSRPPAISLYCRDESR